MLQNTHFVHAVLVTRHLMGQWDAAVQMRMALWPLMPWSTFLVLRGHTGQSWGPSDPNSDWTRAPFQSSESYERFHPELALNG